MASQLTVPFTWVGTKVSMRRALLPIIDTIPRRLYVEPFFGAGGLFFGKEREKAEVVNDRNDFIMNLFRTLRDEQNYREVMRLLDATPMSRSAYYELFSLFKLYFQHSHESRIADMKRLARLDGYSDEVVKAYVFFYIKTTCFGGTGIKRTFAGGQKGDHANKIARDYLQKRSNLHRYVSRLDGVVLESLDVFDCVSKYDDASTLFYLDPPYDSQSTKEYKLPWRDDEERALVDTLANIKGRFVLTCYDTPNYRRLLDANCERIEVKRKSTISSFCKENELRIETIYIKR